MKIGTGIAVRGLAVAAFVVVAGLVIPVPAVAQDEPVPPRPLVPPTPEAAEPVADGLGPVAWRTCDAVGLAFGLTVLSGTLAGAPAEATVPVNELVAAASGPALGAFFEVCQQVPLAEEPPTCATDESVPALPTLGRPLPPFATLVQELSALEGSLGQLAPRLDGALSERVADLLGCTEGRDPEPEPTAPPVEPPAEPSGPPAADGPDATRADGGSDTTDWSVPGPAGPAAIGHESAAEPVSEEAATDAIPPYRSAATSAPTESGVTRALALLLLTALAAGLWATAGSERRSEPSPAERR